LQWTKNGPQALPQVKSLLLLVPALPSVADAEQPGQ
jgi:hypothetical protein